MEDKSKQAGRIAWVDLTVPEAGKLRDFYTEVVGWRPSPVSMGDYSDFSMVIPGEENPTAGICHARGVNADLPAQWMIYIVVENLDTSIAACKKNGGKVISGPRKIGEERYCVIEDPAGAVAALYEKS